MSAEAASWWTQHGSHAALIGGPVAAAALLGAAADVRRWMRRHPLDRRLLAAALLSVLAAVVHVSVCPEHFREGLLYGVFFAMTSAFQLSWGLVAAVRFRPWLASIGVTVNLALVALWSLTRTAGVPLGPERGEIEAPGLLDVAATAAELGLAAVCLWTLLQLRRPAATADAS